VKVRSPKAAELRELLLRDGVTLTGDAEQLEVTGLTSDEIGLAAADARIPLFELTPVQASLEEVFMDLTRDSVEYGITAPRTELTSSGGHRR
jgi:ABC-2 type transport system ATP-binding protein